MAEHDVDGDRYDDRWHPRSSLALPMSRRPLVGVAQAGGRRSTSKTSAEVLVEEEELAS